MVKEEMQEVGAREDEVFVQSSWRIDCDDPWRKKPKTT